MNERQELDLRARQIALAPLDERYSLATSLRADLRAMGVYPASIRSLYQALGRGELPAMTVPAFNVRGLTYELGRAFWRTALELQAGPFLFELAPSEASTGHQTFEEYAALALAAAAREGYRGPVFLQGDHFGIDSPAEQADVLALAQRAIKAGFYQLDIDASYLADPQSNDLAGRHLPNARATASMITDLRGLEPQGAWLTLGGEVGEIGGPDTSVPELLAFCRDVSRHLPAGVDGLDKVSAQTGTRHGGIVQPDGAPGCMEMDIDLAADLSRQARALGLAGLVQHGASTLSLDDLARLPAAGVVEVHLATQIQNIAFDHPAFPPALLNQMRERLVTSAREAEGDRTIGREPMSEAQRFYHSRWTAWGLFRAELLDLSEGILQPITQSLGAWVGAIFRALRVDGCAERVRAYAGEPK